FADQNYGVSVGVVVEELDSVEERCADNGIAADSDTGGLADAEARELVHCFVGEGAAAADDSHVALLVNASWHDADFALAGRNDARAVGANQARLRFVHHGGDTDHVDYRNAFGDADDQRNLRICGFEDRICCVWWRNKDHRGTRAGSFYGFSDSIE